MPILMMRFSIDSAFSGYAQRYRYLIGHDSRFAYVDSNYIPFKFLTYTAESDSCAKQ